jgi:NitT/TauT family transport system ATP-binding protein
MSSTESAASIPAVELSGLGVTYGGPTGREVLRGIDLTVAPGEIVCIVGHSGIGKSTLIRCIAGLQKPTTGDVRIAGIAIDAPPATLALVSQDYGRTLMPWLRVGENVRLPLRGNSLARKVQNERVTDALAGARDQLTTKADPLFIECRTRVLSAIQQSKTVAPV